jgi:hypothetical protein
MGLKYSCILFHTWGDYLDIKLLVSFMHLKEKKNQKKLKSLFKFLKEKNTQNFIIQYFKSPSKNI